MMIQVGYSLFSSCYTLFAACESESIIKGVTFFLLLGNQSEGGDGGDTELNETLPFDVVKDEHMEEQDDDEEVNDGGDDHMNKAAAVKTKRTHCIANVFCCLFLSFIFMECLCVTSGDRKRGVFVPAARQCRYCHKYFQQLSAHERLHLTATRYAHACTYAGCTYACATATALRQHERVHTGERPYECDVCAQAFAKQNHLSCHQRLKHAAAGAIARFRCHQCNRAWDCKGLLRAHLQNEHNITLHKGDFIC